jgi:hypothetical protein
LEGRLKKILIIYPHFPPSNLAGVHRARLFAKHLPSFGWEPVILTVHEDFYEEELDWNLHKLLPDDLRIEKVKALKITKPRLIGDIGLRAFYQLHRKAKQLIKEEEFDFLYIPIPSFYCALLGRVLHKTTGIKYGIDYIDPWVHEFPGSNQCFSRHWFTTKLAKILEPIAVKKASLITGVAEGYYDDVLKRNPHLKTQAVTGAMPYGGEERDYSLLAKLNIEPYLFKKKEGVIQLIYAGALLPKAFDPLEAIFKSLQSNSEILDKVEFHFIGTGKTPNDASGFTIKPLAEKYNLWKTIVYEYPKRIPYLDVLVHLHIAGGIFILGSSEKHYTPSKTYQGILSGKPILAVLHKDCEAIEVLEKSGAGKVLRFDGELGIGTIEQKFPVFIVSYLKEMSSFKNSSINKSFFSEFSAEAVTKKLVDLLEKVKESDK